MLDFLHNSLGLETTNVNCLIFAIFDTLNRAAFSAPEQMQYFDTFDHKSKVKIDDKESFVVFRPSPPLSPPSPSWCTVLPPVFFI